MSDALTTSDTTPESDSPAGPDGWRVGWQDGAVVLAYLLSLLLAGAISSYRSKSSSISGYFLASRSMHWLPVGASLFASNVGSGHFVGLAGTAAKTGIAIASFELNASYILLLLGWVFVPVYMSSGVYTMPEYLRLRFGGQRIRVYLAVLSLILYIFIRISADLYAGALFITVALNKSSPEWLYISVVILLVIAAIFTIVGGLTVVIWTDFVQTALMIVGAFVLMARSFSAVGGYDRLIEDFFKAVPNKTVGNCGEPPAYSMHFFRSAVPGESDLPWTGMMFGITVSAVWCWCTDQVIVQRTLASRNLSHAKGGCVVGAFLKFLPQFFLIFPGMAARILYTDRVACVLPEECDKICGSEAGCTNIAYVELVLNLLPPGLTGLMLAVMMAALITSLTSIFNSASTIFTIDIWTQIRRRATDVEKLIVGRAFVLVLVAVSVVWIPVLQSSNSAQLFVYIQNVTSFLAPPICSVFVIAVLWKRANEQGAFWGLMIGLVIGLIRFIMEFAYIVPPCGSGKEDPRPEVIRFLVGQVHYLHFGILLFFIVAAITVSVSFLTPPIPEPCLARLTFWTRYDRRPRPPLPSKKGTGRGVSTVCNANRQSGEINPAFSGMVEENGQLGTSSSVAAQGEEPSSLLRCLQFVCCVRDLQDPTTPVGDKGANFPESQQEQVDASVDFLTETEEGKMYTNAGAMFILVVAAFIWGFYA